MPVGSRAKQEACGRKTAYPLNERRGRRLSPDAGAGIPAAEAAGGLKIPTDPAIVQFNALPIRRARSIFRQHKCGRFCSEKESRYMLFRAQFKEKRSGDAHNRAAGTSVIPHNSGKAAIQLSA
jgi:hypothetical protein